MINIGISELGMNSSKYYRGLFDKLELDNPVNIEYVIPDKHYDYILFDGGSDVSPEFYNQINIASHVDIVRDEYEIDIFNRYKDTNTKFVGICRGHQLLNVLYGGTLYQNLGRYNLQHPGYHMININQNADSSIKNILPSITMVNSLHHQAVRKLANNLYSIAVEINTGIIEIYGEINDKVRAVQFHPEFYNAFPYTKEILKWLFRFI